MYQPKDGNTWLCLDGSTEIMFSQVNDVSRLLNYINIRTTVTVPMDLMNQVHKSKDSVNTRNLGVSQRTILLCKHRPCPGLYPLLPCQRRSLRPPLLRRLRRIQRHHKLSQHLQRTRCRRPQSLRRTIQITHARLAYPAILPGHRSP